MRILVTGGFGASPSLVRYEDSEVLTTKSKRIDLSKSLRELIHNHSYSLFDGIQLTADWMKRAYLL
ncbi:MAG TPA: hypothetical protein VFD75_02445 [Pyrinomonadaceae bacterium]|jgi:hypothetical protein|nr:hypothetical protein [Pyrinomonadaceae bacterium]